MFKKTFFPLALFLFFGLMSSCNLQEPVAVDAADSPATPQLLASSGSATSCIDCPGGCVLGFPFNPTNLDGNHPQGGYPVTLILGNCECKSNGSGSWSWVVNGTSTSHCGQTGGPASGSANTLGAAQTLWGFTCGGGGGGGGGGNGGGNGGGHSTWGSWVSYAEEQLQANPQQPIGTGSWPMAWNVNVQPTSHNGPVRLSLPGVEQASALASFRILANETNTTLAEFHSTGAPSYDLDMSALPAGIYTLEMWFDPGFYLSTSFLKSETE